MNLLDFSDIAKMFEEIEIRLIKSLKRNLSRHKQWEKDEGFRWSAWQAEKLRNIEKFRRENRSIMNEYTDVIDDRTRRLMEEQFREGEENVLRGESVKAWSGRSEDSWRNRGRDRIRENQWKRTDVMPKKKDENAPHFFGVNEQKMEKLISDMIEIEKTCETAALRMTDDVYRQTLYKAQLAMGAGEMTLEKAIDLSVKDFLDKGLNCIVYSDGRRVNIADYVRMALSTASTRATLQGEAKRRAELGIDTVQVSQYGRCSDTCLPWQGQVYIDDVFTPWTGEHDEYQGKSNYCGKWFWLLSYAVKNGLFHPNCRHNLLDYQDGITAPPPVLDGKKIRENAKLEQKQRAMERKIRKLRRFAEGTLDPDTAKAYRKKLRQAQHELKVFTDEHSDVLRRDYEREKIYDGEVDKSEKYGIIKTGEVKSLEQAKKRDHKIYITDVAVNKVSKSYIPILNEKQNKKIFENHKELLRISKNENDSNEVALLFDLNSEENAVKLGDEHEVNIFLNPNAVSMANHSELNALFLAHNHPSTQNFSYSDLGVFLMNDSIGGISVVSNTGDVHILFKSASYDFDRAYEYISGIRAKYSDYDAEVDQAIVKEFLKNSKKIGILQY